MCCYERLARKCDDHEFPSDMHQIVKIAVLRGGLEPGQSMKVAKFQ